MAKLIIVRGPSGSGKSTIAGYLSDNGKLPRYEADMYFEKGGRYQFDPQKLWAAHQWCVAQVSERLKAGHDVIVSNTSMALREINPYLALGYTEIEIWRTPAPWDTSVLVNRNIHDVPLKSLEHQIQRYVPVEGEREWTKMDIFN